jgi:2',3'-cyclic-nucleotide 2'-phosphodiesterase (5'-nucleotidase family)
LDLRKRSLRTGESPLGNLVADIIREHFQTDLSFYNSGLIRGDKTVPAGEISTSDLSKMFPFGDSIHLLRLSGATLKQVLERSVSALPEAKGWFLQVSGLRYTAKINKMPQKLNIGADGRATAVAQAGRRVLGIEVLNSNGKYYPLDPDKIYSVATNDFIAQGGDGYIMLKAIQERQDSSIPLKDVVTEGLRKRKEIELATFHRIVFLAE